MDKRERVLRALSHQTPDRVPLSIGTTIVDGLTRFAKDAYEEYLGVPVTQNAITNVAMQTVVTPDWLLEKTDSEFRSVRMKSPLNNHTVFLEDGSFNDEYGILWKKSDLYYDPVHGPLYGEITLQDIKNNPWADASDKGRVQGLKEEAIKYREQGYAVVADIICGGPFEQALWMRGWDDFLCDLYLQPEVAEALMDRITEGAIQLWDVLLSEIGEYIDVACQGDDMGIQDRSVISIDLYNKYVKKYHKRLFDFIKSKTKAKVFLHSCGSVHELLPGFIEAGVDILNPVQITARNMEPERLKNDFGRELCFWGGIDTQRIMPFGTEEEIEGCVRRLVDVLGKDGGYILAPGHNLQKGVAPKSIDAMIRAMMQYR